MTFRRHSWRGGSPPHWVLLLTTWGQPGAGLQIAGRGCQLSRHRPDGRAQLWVGGQQEEEWVQF